MMQQDVASEYSCLDRRTREGMHVPGTSEHASYCRGRALHVVRCRVPAG